MAETIPIGAVTSLCTLAWQVCKYCKNASGSFKGVSSELLSLHAVLRETNENLSRSSLSEARIARLTTVIHSCREVAKEVEVLVTKYKKLDNKTQRVWHNVGWHTEDLTELRLRLGNNADLLTALITYFIFKILISRAMLMSDRHSSSQHRRRAKTESTTSRIPERTPRELYPLRCHTHLPCARTTPPKLWLFDYKQ